MPVVIVCGIGTIVCGVGVIVRGIIVVLRIPNDRWNIVHNFFHLPLGRPYLNLGPSRLKVCP